MQDKANGVHAVRCPKKDNVASEKKGLKIAQNTPSNRYERFPVQSVRKAGSRQGIRRPWQPKQKGAQKVDTDQLGVPRQVAKVTCPVTAARSTGRCNTI